MKSGAPTEELCSAKIIFVSIFKYVFLYAVPPMQPKAQLKASHDQTDSSNIGKSTNT